MPSVKTHGNNAYPRLLIIDSFPAGYPSATGKVKAMFIEGWPDESVLQVCVDLATDSLAVVQGKGGPPLNMSTGQEELDVVEQCLEFSPEVIYFRPNEYLLIFSIATRLINTLQRPFIIHMMDDWPERLRVNNPDVYQQINPQLRKHIDQAACRLSISKKMSIEYARRYAGEWIPLANAVDLNDYPLQEAGNIEGEPRKKDFVIRYSGGLAEDITFQSVVDVAEVVASLQDDYQLRLEINTMKWYLAKAAFLNDLDGVVVSGLVSDQDYIYSLVSADALLIAYNFDPDSIRYIGLSLANKLPECLASATPVLVYGPADVATIDYIRRTGCSKNVTCKDPQRLKQAIVSLLENPSTYAMLGLAACKHAGKHFNKYTTQEKFQSLVFSISGRNASQDS